METTITIICTEANDPEQFERMTLEERREHSGGWKTFPLRSQRFVDTFLMAATGADFGVFDSAEEPLDENGIKVKTCAIMKPSIKHVVHELQAMVEQKPSETAAALVKHGGGTADPAQVAAILSSGTWPTSGDPAEEAAAFAHQLLVYARYAKKDLRGVCWEFRGDVRL